MSLVPLLFAYPCSKFKQVKFSEVVDRSMMITEALYGDYLSHLISGDKRDCSKIVQSLIDQEISVKDLYFNLFQKSMYQIGRLWENNEVSVSVEHVATSITESLLNLAYPLIFSEEHTGNKAIVACVPKEYHQIGAKMVADFIELNGWDSYFLGSNTPAEELLRMIDEKKPDLLALSISLFFSIRYLDHMIRLVQNAFPQLDIIVGGQGMRHGAHKTLDQYSNVQYIESISKLEKLILS